MTVIDLHTLKQASAPKECVLCLGNFDGIHIGHRALVDETLAHCERLKAEFPEVKSGAWFFARSPYDIITKSVTPRLTDISQKLEIFSSLGLDLAFIFDYEEIGGYSPDRFVKETLKEKCGCIFAVCGYNFKFGKGAAGDKDILFDLMDGMTSSVNQVCLDGKRVCSSEIRRLIAAGSIEEANELLGRCYSIHGKVLHGKKLGRTIGIPTINQGLGMDIAIPKNGIYVTRVYIDGECFPSVSNVGVRPSVESDGAVNCETHVLGFDGEIYGKDVKVDFLARLRDEIKFGSIDELKAQINKDIENTKNYFEKRREA